MSLVAIQIKQVRKHVHKRNNTTTAIQIIQNTVNTTNTYYKTHIHTHTHTHLHITKTTHTHTHILQNKLKLQQYKLQQPQFKVYRNEIVTV
jgi:hypothetical protein